MKTEATTQQGTTYVPSTTADLLAREKRSILRGSLLALLPLTAGILLIRQTYLWVFQDFYLPGLGLGALGIALLGVGVAVLGCSVRRLLAFTRAADPAPSIDSTDTPAKSID